jgi:phosphonate transport system substrate-binding protein
MLLLRRCASAAPAGLPTVEETLPRLPGMAMSKKCWRHLLVALAAIPAIAGQAEERQTLIFGVFPYLPTAQLEQLYAPVAADLSAATGLEVQLRSRPSFDLFREELAQQRYDLVYIQPFTYERVARQHGYDSVARPSLPLRAIFIVRSDSDIQGIDQLRGTTLSMPPKRAAVSLLGSATLRRHNLIPGHDLRVIYQNNHGACLRAVLIRKSSACVTARAPLEVLTARTGVHFRILDYSDEIPGATYAVHRRLPAAVRSAITGRIVNWHRTEAGRMLLESLKIPAFVYSSNEDYLPVRRILDSLDALEDPQHNGYEPDATD